MSDNEISGLFQDSVNVPSGEVVTVRANGVVQGTVSIDGELVIEPRGVVQGTVAVEAGGILRVDGTLQGTLSVDPDGEVFVGPVGKVQGVVQNHGTIMVKGSIGGILNGEPPALLGTGRIEVPEERDGKQDFRN